jgi:hypothetical protein
MLQEEEGKKSDKFRKALNSIESFKYVKSIKKKSHSFSLK